MVPRRSTPSMEISTCSLYTFCLLFLSVVWRRHVVVEGLIPNSSIQGEALRARHSRLPQGISDHLELMGRLPRGSGGS
jgi:hypothetical protein